MSHRAVFVLMVLLSAPLRAAEPVGKPAVYKQAGNRELRLWVLNPPDWRSSDARPAIVFFHGGGWVGGNPAQFDNQSRYLATRGMVCVQVEYRLLARMASEPPLVCVQDAKSAMRWVRSHAAALGIDPRRIAAGGGSAGGHLAAFTGMVGGLDDPQDNPKISARADALVLFNPAIDNGPEGGAAAARMGDRYREFSPAHNISADDPPAIIFLGTKDRLIPVNVVERFQSNMEQAKVRCDVRLYDGQAHGFFNREPYQSQTLYEADKFLGSLGWIEGPPTLKLPAQAAADPAGEKK